MRGSKGSKTPGMAGQERRIPAPISPELTAEVQQNALRAFEALNAGGVARVDSFVNTDTGETWVMEINTVPGSFSFYLWEASGTSFGELMEQMLHSALAAHAARRELLFSYDSGMLQGAQLGGKTRG